MGAYFSNLHISRDGASKEDVKKLVCKYFTARGFIAAEAENADFAIKIFAPSESPWITVLSESFTHKDVIDLTQIMAAKIDTSVMSISCFDSDYLFVFLQNVNKGLDLWLNIGESYEIKKPRRGNLSKWKKYVKDFPAFKRIAEESYICAEDFLSEAERHLSIPYAQSTMVGDEESVENAEKLYFLAPKKVELDSTVLKIKHFDLYPRIPEHPTGCFAQNIGTASRGIRILFMGDYVENGDITIEDASFVYFDSKDNPIVTPITFERTRLSNGAWVYLWEDKDFNIQEAPSLLLPPRALQEEESKRSFGIRYTPKGNKRKFLDICTVFIPLDNPDEGHCWWRVWAYHKSKREYIEDHNNRIKRDAEQFEIPNWRNLLIDPDEYDLD